VYADQATRLGYVHLQKGATVEETLEGKKAFEAYTRSHSISIKTCHADNGIFRAHKWVDCCRMAKQGLTFTGVNSHNKNGIAKRRIKDSEGPCWLMQIAGGRWVSTPICGHTQSEWQVSKSTTRQGCRAKIRGPWSIVETLKEFLTLLYGCPNIHVFTDHKNNMFKHLQTQHVLRLRLFLDDYTVKFHYIKGNSNTLANALSCLPFDERQKAYALPRHDYHKHNIQAVTGSCQSDWMMIQFTFDLINTLKMLMIFIIRCMDHLSYFNC
jgi:hypothetical protein